MRSEHINNSIPPHWSVIAADLELLITLVLVEVRVQELDGWISYLDLGLTHVSTVVILRLSQSCVLSLSKLLNA